MSIKFQLWSIVTLFFITIGIIWWLRAPEIIIVRAINSVPLFDPNSLAGTITTSPKVVGELKPDETLVVVECVDTKSDVILNALYKAQIVTIGDWQAKIELRRHHAYPWEHGAITSCVGYG